MSSIIKRSPEQIAEELSVLKEDDLIKIVLELDKIVSDYRFTFSVIKSLIYEIKEEGDFISKKAIQEQIDKAKLVKLYE